MEIQCEECGVFNDLEDVDVTQGLHLTCKDKQSCKTRQRLRSKEIINIVSRRNMSQTDTPVDNDQFHKKAKTLVAVDFNEAFVPDDLDAKKATPDDFYVVWFAKVLGNWKALVSTDLVSGQYWEVTHNGAKQETYIDRYQKANNWAATDEYYASVS
ncbi:hypothetical protein PBI_EGAD_42 [Arthrobacter phage Egad]|nr:hypothetical protein PBI_EGAD_42 [Arthrobacter phage Egad]